jgi:hypothetical protein
VASGSWLALAAAAAGNVLWTIALGALSRAAILARAMDWRWSFLSSGEAAQVDEQHRRQVSSVSMTLVTRLQFARESSQQSHRRIYFMYDGTCAQWLNAARAQVFDSMT